MTTVSVQVHYRNIMFMVNHEHADVREKIANPHHTHVYTGRTWIN